MMCTDDTRSADTRQRKLALLGGGGHACVVADAARHAGWSLVGFFDDDPDAGVPTLVHLGAIEAAEKLADAHSSNQLTTHVHAAVGDGMIRLRWIAQFAPDRIARVLDPSAVVSPSAMLGAGVFVGPRAVLNARVDAGVGVIVNSGAIVEHDCVLAEGAHIAPRAVLGGGAHVGRCAIVGIGATILPRVTIGADSTVGGGAVVTRDVPEGATVAGNPARTL